MVASGDVTIDGNVELQGTTGLILMDGAHLKITGSIYGNFPLSIYGQAKGTVRLDVNYGMDDSQHEDKEYGIKVDNLTIQGGPCCLVSQQPYCYR